jgi:hypothetical protein
VGPGDRLGKPQRAGARPSAGPLNQPQEGIKDHAAAREIADKPGAHSPGERASLDLGSEPCPRQAAVRGSKSREHGVRFAHRYLSLTQRYLSPRSSTRCREHEPDHDSCNLLTIVGTMIMSVTARWRSILLATRAATVCRSQESVAESLRNPRLVPAIVILQFQQLCRDTLVVTSAERRPGPVVRFGQDSCHQVAKIVVTGRELSGQLSPVRRSATAAEASPSGNNAASVHIDPGTSDRSGHQTR